VAGARRHRHLLLATDSMYLMTSVFDWGPCALQHFFLAAVMLAFIYLSLSSIHTHIYTTSNDGMATGIRTWWCCVRDTT